MSVISPTLLLLFLLGIELINVDGKKVYSFDDAMDALEKGYDIKTVQIYSNCDATKQTKIVDVGGLKIDYFFQESMSSSNNKSNLNHPLVHGNELIIEFKVVSS